VGMGGNILLVSMRDIAAGEELTIDHALFLGMLASPWNDGAEPRPVEAWRRERTGRAPTCGSATGDGFWWLHQGDRPNPGPSDPIAAMENAEPDILPALLRTTPAAVRHAESATCLDRRWEPGDLGSSGAERGGFARESAAVAFGCSGSRTPPRPACSPGEVVAQERSARPEVALPSSPEQAPDGQEEFGERRCDDRGGSA
jgi:hypothetical protein